MYMNAAQMRDSEKREYICTVKYKISTKNFTSGCTIADTVAIVIDHAPVPARSSAMNPEKKRNQTKRKERSLTPEVVETTKPQSPHCGEPDWPILGLAKRA